MVCKLVCFDCDGTLVDEVEFIWQFVHRSLGIDRGRILRATEDFRSGRITFAEWARHDVALWIGKGANRQVLTGIVGRLRLMNGAMETLEELRRRGMRLAVVSGGIDLVLEHFMPGYRDVFDRVMINRLVFGGDGSLRGIIPTEFGADEFKAEGLRKIAGEFGLGLGDCAFVGDSDNDVEIAKQAGLSIGFNPHPRLAEVCDVVIRKKDLREVLKHIE